MTNSRATPPMPTNDETRPLDETLLVALLNDASRGIYGGEKDDQLRALAAQLPELIASRAALHSSRAALQEATRDRQALTSLKVYYDVSAEGDAAWWAIEGEGHSRLFETADDALAAYRLTLAEVQLKNSANAHVRVQD